MLNATRLSSPEVDVNDWNLFAQRVSEEDSSVEAVVLVVLLAVLKSNES